MEPHDSRIQQRAQIARDTGIHALRSGDRATARTSLCDAVSLNPQDAMAWLWLSGAVATPSEQRYCLERVLEHEPTHPAAQRGLVLLGMVAPTSPLPVAFLSAPEASLSVVPEPAAPSATSIPFARSLPDAPLNARPAAPTMIARPQPRSNTRLTQVVMCLMLIGVVGLGGALAWAAWRSPSAPAVARGAQEAATRAPAPATTRPTARPTTARPTVPPTPIPVPTVPPVRIPSAVPLIVAQPPPVAVPVALSPVMQALHDERERQDFHGAIDQYTAIIADDPQNADAYFFRGDHHPRAMRHAPVDCHRSGGYGRTRCECAA